MESIRLGLEEISNLNSIVATAKEKEDRPANEEYDSDAGQEGGFQTLLTQQVKEETEKLEKKINAIQNKNERLEEKLDKNQTQYITILGIFASIVLAFVGAFTFSTSVLAHMHEVSFYRLSFVILCIAFLVVNILQGLFDFLRNIHDNKYEKKYKLFTWFNMLIFFAMLCIFIHYSIRESFVFNQIESHIPWLVWLFA